MFIIGDTHCKRHIVEAALNLPGQKVFLGDLVDAYGLPTLQEQVDIVRMVLDDPDSICLLGNHEASYLYPPMQCSGYQESLGIQLRKTGLMERIESECKPFLYFSEDKLLISHAGLTGQIWRESDVSKLEASLLDWYRSKEEFISPYWWIGRCRGGGRPVGGILWCDWYREFRPVPGLNQIVGHTKVPRPEWIEDDGCWTLNIDCLDSVHMVAEWQPGWAKPRIQTLLCRAAGETHG